MEENRQTGQTTRIVDAAIQELFQTGEVVIEDHYQSPQANRYAVDLMRRRMKSEHPSTSIRTEGVRIILLTPTK